MLNLPLKIVGIMWVRLALIIGAVLIIPKSLETIKWASVR
ncbi:MAG: hypothetical protein ACJATI_003752 [Halioglobus sp.]|jgi:hypothetical protein